MSLPVEDLSQDEPGRKPGRPRIGWHQVDPVSMVAGLLTVCVALLGLLSIDVDVGVVLPVLLLAVGALGLASAVRRTTS